jgi:hypothetical protein
MFWVDSEVCSTVAPSGREVYFLPLLDMACFGLTQKFVVLWYLVEKRCTTCRYWSWHVSD